MQFGKVAYPEKIDFVLPPDHPETEKVLMHNGSKSAPDIFVGCAKWNRADLKGFYPKGTKDELAYYSSQFNCIEFNASFYRIFPSEQFKKWKDKTPKNFRFFPKVNQEISHVKRLLDVKPLIDEYVYSVSFLEKKLGMAFLQLHESFTPNYFNRVVVFLEYWPKHIPLAIEFRHTDWYNDHSVANELYEILESNNISNIITDTAGRRDLLHMRLTNSAAFIRYVGSNHSSDYTRLDEWVKRLSEWKRMGIRQIYFFIHQNSEQESPSLAAYFIKQLNQTLHCNLKVPLSSGEQQSLF